MISNLAIFKIKKENNINYKVGWLMVKSSRCAGVKNLSSFSITALKKL
jgi:hypothetical protein